MANFFLNRAFFLPFLIGCLFQVAGCAPKGPGYLVTPLSSQKFKINAYGDTILTPSEVIYSKWDKAASSTCLGKGYDIVERKYLKGITLNPPQAYDTIVGSVLCKSVSSWPAQISQESLNHDISGSQIISVQRLLINAGYDPGTADGIMGRKTSEALKKFQRDHGLPPTGEINDETWEVLSAVKGKQDIRQEHTTERNYPVQSETIKTRQESSPILHEDKILSELDDQPIAPAVEREVPVPPEKIFQALIIETTELKSKPDAFSGEVIISLPHGSTVEILDEQGDWWNIRFNEYEGYVYKDFVEKK